MVLAHTQGWSWPSSRSSRTADSSSVSKLKSWCDQGGPFPTLGRFNVLSLTQRIHGLQETAQPGRKWLGQLLRSPRCWTCQTQHDSTAWEQATSLNIGKSVAGKLCQAMSSYVKPAEHGVGSTEFTSRTHCHLGYGKGPKHKFSLLSVVPRQFLWLWVPPIVGPNKQALNITNEGLELIGKWNKTLSQPQTIRLPTKAQGKFCTLFSVFFLSTLRWMVRKLFVQHGHLSHFDSASSSSSSSSLSSLSSRSEVNLFFQYVANLWHGFLSCILRWPDVRNIITLQSSVISIDSIKLIHRPVWIIAIN